MTAPAAPAKASTKAPRPQPSPPAFADLIDSHCHLDYDPMAGDLDGTFARARAVGVRQLVHIGCSFDRHAPALALAAAHEHIHCTIGIHPHDAITLTPDTLAALERAVRSPKVVAVGETGLDYHYDRSPREQQQWAFEQQIQLAHRLNLPLTLHIRDAHADAWEIIDRNTLPTKPGIVHCFTGGPDEAREWLDRGFHLSFSGIATFNTAAPIREALRLCPPDRILLETDAPFLAPLPVRGRPNEPALMAFTAQRLADERGEDAAAFTRRCSENTRALLGLPAPASPAN